MKIRFAAALRLLLAFVSMCALPNIAQASTLTVQQARKIIAPFYQALNAGNDAIAHVNQATSPDWLSCNDADSCKRRDEVGAAIAALHKSVPDLKWEIKEVLVSGNQAIVRGEASGTPAGTFMGAPPGGRSFRIMSIDIHTIRDGKLIKAYHVEDWMRAVHQLSAQ